MSTYSGSLLGKDLTAMMSSDINFEDRVFNSFVPLPGTDPELIKCSCCNITFTDIDEHLNTQNHKNSIHAYANLASKFTNSAGLIGHHEEMFKASIAISLPSILQSKSVNTFHSYCYTCLRVLTNGTNGIKQHLKNGHRLLLGHRYFCYDCCIHLDNLKNHLQISAFHKLIIQDLKSYGVQLTADLFTDQQGCIVNVPSNWTNIIEYRKIFLNLVIDEMKSQRDHARTCRIDNLSISWNSGKASNKPAVGIFKLSAASDDEFFRIKLADELVVYLDSEGWSMRCTVTAVPYDFKMDDVYITLVNNTGLKPHIMSPYSITPKFSSTVFWRFRNALNQVQSLSDHMKNIFLNKTENEEDYNYSSDNSGPPMILEINSKNKVNDLQEKAIELALKKNIVIIHGPPGTGKTATCALIIANLRRMYPDKRILACAPSNKAIDKLTSVLENYKIDPVRVFSNKRENFPSEVKHLSLINLAFCKNPTLNKDYESYINNTLPAKEHKDYREEFELTKSKVLSERMVACTTLITAGGEQLDGVSFDFVLIDEASQALEPETLIPLTTFKPSKVILAGDHKQLQPLVLSTSSKHAGFSISMFERLKKTKTIPNIMLEYQYRMRPLIALFSNIQFYENQLKNGIKDEDRTCNLKLFKPNDKAMIFINVNGKERTFGKSYSNPKEGEGIVKLIEYLIVAENISPDDIGVLTFYEGQNVFLHHLITLCPSLKGKKIEIANVDSYQGNEKFLIIMSLVRSNDDMNIGFLGDEKRLNVALTRAKFKLIIFGNRRTFETDPLYKSLFKHIDRNCICYEENIISECKNYLGPGINHSSSQPLHLRAGTPSSSNNPITAVEN